jgi:NADH-ubiquinone oxidoreductase chain 5
MVKPNSYKSVINNVYESNIFICIPLFFLSINSIFFGFINKDLFVGMGTDTWQNSIDVISTKNLLILESEFLPYYIKSMPLLFSLLGILFMYILNYYFYSLLFLNNIFGGLFLILNRFFVNKWYIDILYNKIIVKYFKKMSYINLKLIDRGIIELIGPLGIVRIINFIMNLLNRIIQTGLLYNYIFIFILSLLLIFIRYNSIYINLDIVLYFIILYIIIFKNK